MKKILSTLLLSSFIIPSLVFALQPVYRTTEEYTTAEEKALNDYSEAKRVQEIRKNSNQTLISTTTRVQQKEMRPEARLSASTTRTRTASSTRENGFCAQIDKIFVQVDIKGLTGAEKRAENVTNREEKREGSRTKVDLHREENDIKRKTQLEELTRRATTTEQKAAVLAFTTIVEKALSNKKIALDALLLVHRNEVDKVTASRKIMIEKAITLLRADIEAAKTKAKLDCTSGVASDSVRTTLKDSIQKSQQTFRITMQSLEKDTLSLKRESKKEELQAIETAFKKSVEQAKNNLKAALNVKASASATN